MFFRLAGPASRRDLLTIYLADHDATGAAAVSLARRAASNARHAGTADQLGEVAEALAHDRLVARRVMGAVDADPTLWKVVAGQVAERVGRLKLNGRVRGYSRLSQVLELEGLLDALAARRRLWQTAAEVPGLCSAAGVDVTERLRSLEQQVDRLEPLWQAATGTAFPGVRVDARSP